MAAKEPGQAMYEAWRGPRVEVFGRWESLIPSEKASWRRAEFAASEKAWDEGATVAISSLPIEASYRDAVVARIYAANPYRLPPKGDADEAEAKLTEQQAEHELTKRELEAANECIRTEQVANRAHVEARKREQAEHEWRAAQLRQEVRQLTTALAGENARAAEAERQLRLVADERANISAWLTWERLHRDGVASELAAANARAGRLDGALTELLGWIRVRGRIENHGHRKPGTNCVECQVLNAAEAALSAAPQASTEQAVSSNPADHPDLIFDNGVLVGQIFEPSSAVAQGEDRPVMLSELLRALENASGNMVPCPASRALELLHGEFERKGGEP